MCNVELTQHISLAHAAVYMFGFFFPDERWTCLCMRPSKSGVKDENIAATWLQHRTPGWWITADRCCKNCKSLLALLSSEPSSSERAVCEETILRVCDLSRSVLFKGLFTDFWLYTDCVQPFPLLLFSSSVIQMLYFGDDRCWKGRRAALSPMNFSIPSRPLSCCAVDWAPVSIWSAAEGVNIVFNSVLHCPSSL